MLRFLNGESNVKGGPDENYAREFVELFTLGVDDLVTGAKNYSENDLRSSRSRSPVGTSTTPTRTRQGGPLLRSMFNGPKSIFGRLTDYNTDASSTSFSARTPPPYIVRSCGRIHAHAASARDAAEALSDYVASGRKIKPLVRAILTDRSCSSRSTSRHDQAPVVYVSGALRAVGLGVGSSGRPTTSTRWVIPYSRRRWRAGGRLSWLNTDTGLARFGSSAIHRPCADPVPGEGRRRPRRNAARGLRPAFAAVGAPWMSASTRAAIYDYAGRAPVKSSNDRIARQVILRTLMLAGPDAQVM